MNTSLPAETAGGKSEVEGVIAVDPHYQDGAGSGGNKKTGFFERFRKDKTKAVKSEEDVENGEEKSAAKKNDEAGMSNYIRIMRYGTGFDWTLQTIGFFMAIATGVAYPMMTIILGNLVTGFTEFFQPNSTVSAEEFRRSVDKMCLYFVYLFLGKFLSGYISIACFRITGTRISAALRLEYLTSVFRQDLAYFDALAMSYVPDTDVTLDMVSAPQDAASTPTAAAGTPGAVAVSITTLSNTVQQGISEKLGMFVQYTAMLFTGFAIAFAKDWRLTLVTTCILPATILIYGVSIPIEIKLEKRVLAAQAKAAELAEEVLGSVRTVKSFNGEKRLIERYQVLLEKGRAEGIKKAPNSGVQYAGAFFVIYCGYALCFWYGIRLFRQGHIKDAGTIITVFFAVLIAVMCFGSIAPQATAIIKAASASHTIFQVIDRKPTIDATSTDGLKPSSVPSGDLVLGNVKFSYPGSGQRKDIIILGSAEEGGDVESGGLSLVFREGQTTAIVGSSGSGKSTIVSLIERWYDPQQGTVSIGGVDIKDLNLRWWRSKIGLVMQEPFLFNDSIYKNVAYGLMGTEWEDVTEEEKRRMVREACIEANASIFVDELPETYDTKVGESGVKLSGGQKQRIAIARSIISKPSILILDEATSAIDPRNERIVQDALDRVSKGRTTITIAHRLSTIKKADQIVVLGRGNVLETGTHEELLSRPNGAYAGLVNGQTLSMGDREGALSDDEEDVVKLEEEDATNVNERLRRTTTWRSKVSIGKGKDSSHHSDVEAAHPTKTKELGAVNCISLLLWEQRYLWPFYLLGLIGAAGGGASFPAQSILLGKFLETFQSIDNPSEFEERANFWALMFFVLAMGVGVFYFMMGAMFTSIQYNLTTHYRLEYFQNVLRQGIPFFDSEGNSAGSLTSKLNSDPTALQNLLGTNSGMITIAFVNILSCSILSLVIGWKLGLVSICSALPFIFLGGLIRVRIEGKLAASMTAVFADSAQFASEAVGAYRTVSSLIMEQSVSERYRTLLAAHAKSTIHTTLYAAVLFSASESINLLGSALCFWYGGRLMSTREYNPFQFFVVYQAIIQSGETAGQFLGYSPDIAQAVQAVNRIVGIREKKKPPPGEIMDHEGKGGYEVEFRNVDFKYSTRDANVFRNLNLKIEKGQFAAFVGASGCGKTTTISLLERFYSVTGGEILVDGRNIDSLDIESYRNAVSLVAQEPTLYQGTIAENVRLGSNDENISHEAVIQACKEAHIHDFISSLPDGYETLCGARGVGLSGGQKQRVAIARALIRKPKILLLDEATASLDTESEKIVQKAFEGAAQGRTMIAVAHRLSTIQKADVIFVFDDGKVVEQGSHAALVKMKGTYYQMCQAQALDQ
ncbi:uncharacterized protein LAJ45_02203 [Morchella importuna]|uniref:uncharacterized protein n=1 Tax=Morchella importuna TaxID=1174673 RepID=UPI001E8CB5FD|nr:uncharacterized protein LAJ45_02203 [Morchella importuna]KAH8153391.1 hypothetical protein LAJ45_02203 [Morchella importuna]